MSGSSDEVVGSMHDPRVIDPEGQLVDRQGIPDADVDQIIRVMESLRGWHRAAERMSQASRHYMNLNETDMRALRYLISAGHQGRLATPGALASYLGISTASTTKLLDRLEQAGHVIRTPHPSDRRSLTVSVTDTTQAAARRSVGQLHARRFAVAAGLSPRDREVVIGFLDALAATEDPG